MLLVCAVLPLTIAAGFWQLDRADQKRTALAQQEAGFAQSPQNLAEVIDVANYVRVYIEGQWSEEVFLLDNRTRSGRVGYEVVSLVRTENLAPVLVNRGWIPAGNDRTVLPKVEQPLNGQRVEGYLYRATQKPIVFEEQVWTQTWPERAQVIDFELMQQRIGEELYPFVLRIDRQSPLAFQADWKIERDGPGMHIGYAFQWFAMALTIVIMTVFANSNLWKWWKGRQTKV